MTSVSSASSNNSASYSAQKKLYSKLDTDGNGILTNEEFVTGRPQDVSEDEASALYSKIDTDNSGAVSKDKFEEGMASRSPSLGVEALFSSGAMTVLMGMRGGMSSASDLYDSMDTDGDGSVSQAEFLAAKPDDFSDEDAQALYDSIDTEATGSTTEEQFSETLDGPPLSGMPVANDEGVVSTVAMYDTLDVNKDGVVSEEEFVAAHPADITDEQAANLFGSFDTDSDGSITPDELSASMDQPQNQVSADAKASVGVDELLALLGAASNEKSSKTT